MKSLWKALGYVVVVGSVLMGWQTMAAAAPFAYVVHQSDNNAASPVWVIDIATNTVLTTIQVNGTSTGVAAAPDGSHVYVSVGNTSVWAQ